MVASCHWLSVANLWKVGWFFCKIAYSQTWLISISVWKYHYRGMMLGTRWPSIRGGCGKEEIFNGGTKGLVLCSRINQSERCRHPESWGCTFIKRRELWMTVNSRPSCSAGPKICAGTSARHLAEKIRLVSLGAGFAPVSLRLCHSGWWNIHSSSADLGYFLIVGMFHLCS